MFRIIQNYLQTPSFFIYGETFNKEEWIIFGQFASSVRFYENFHAGVELLAKYKFTIKVVLLSTLYAILFKGVN